MSTGTNRERLEQNNTLLEDIKTQIQNLPEAGSSGGIKQFSTIEEMNNSIGNKEGDMAVVYRNEVQNATVDSKFQTATFPDTVVLDSAITDYVEVRYRAVDSSKMFDCRGSLNSSRFRMDCYTDSGRIRIQYTSSDGITYTRTDTTGNPVDFGTEIYYEMTEMWNDAIGKFIQVGGSTFEGLYEYKSHSSDELIEGLTSVVSPSSYQTSTVEIRDIQRVVELVENKLDTDVGLGSHPSRIYSIIKINNIYRVYFGIYIDSTYGNIESPVGLLFTDDKSYVTFGTSHTMTDILITDNLADTNGTTYKPYCYDVDIINEIVTDTQLSTSSFTQITVGSNIKMKGPELTNLGIIVQYNVSGSGSIAYNVSYITSSGSSGTIQNLPTEVWDYLLADTQLTLSSSNQLLPNVVGYGKNGVVIGDGSIAQPNNTFTDIPAQLYQQIQIAYNNMEPRVLTDDDKTIDKNIYCIPAKSDGTPLLDTSSVTNMSYMFRSCTNLTTIPQLDTSSVTTMHYMFHSCTNLQTIPQLNTSKATNIAGMFYGCTNLTTVPLLNTSKVTNMCNMFGNCTNLSDESLNNILLMCKNATSYTDTKTLAWIGLTSEQANKCKTLSNYSAFTSAGWTTGY